MPRLISAADVNRRKLLRGALSNAGLKYPLWGTNVLLSAMPVMIHAIPVALVHWSPTSSRRNTLGVPQQGARSEK